ncbi:MAG: hypothetical protein OXH75_25430 [Acidobacteria bacterium]|nr:hypothetical protein [Acidobacteriota bacterium]
MGRSVNPAGGRGARFGLRLGIAAGTAAAMAGGLLLAAAIGGGGGAGLDAAARWLADGGRWWLLAGRVSLAGLVWWRWAWLVRRCGARDERARTLAARRHAYLAAYLVVEAMGPGGGMALLVGLAG